jgi:hypothetical protein
MADTFMPLTSGAQDSGATAFRPKVLSAGNATAGFATLHPTSFPTSAPAKATPQSAQPVVTPKREGDRITGVRIQCTCGQVIELAFTL